MSRSTLGFLNEMAFQIRYQVERNGGLDRTETAAINRQLRRTLYNKGDFVYLLDFVAQRLAVRD